jgi:hypothetical protein
MSVKNYVRWILQDGWIVLLALCSFANFYIICQYRAVWQLLLLNVVLFLWSLNLCIQHLARQMLVEGADAIRQTTSWAVIIEAFQTRLGMKLKLVGSYQLHQVAHKALLLRAAEIDKLRFGCRFRNVEMIDIDCSSVNTSGPIDKQVDDILRRIHLQLE